MSKEEFLTKLSKKLRPLPKEEREEALAYYNEYLEEGKVEDLGSVDQVAKEILDQCAIKTLENKETSGFKTFWIVLLAIFAAPMALPIAIALGAVVLALLIAVGAVILSLFIAGLAIWLSGFLYVGAGFYIISESIVNALMLIGMGLVSIGGGILIIVGIFYGAKAIMRLISRLFGKKITGGNIK